MKISEPVNMSLVGLLTCTQSYKTKIELFTIKRQQVKVTNQNGFQNLKFQSQGLGQKWDQCYHGFHYKWLGFINCTYTIGVINSTDMYNLCRS